MHELPLVRVADGVKFAKMSFHSSIQAWIRHRSAVLFPQAQPARVLHGFSCVGDQQIENEAYDDSMGSLWIADDG